MSYTSSCSGKSITLTATLDDGSGLPSWITFNAAGPSFSVSTSDPDDADSYNIKIIATLNDGVGTKDETATLTLDVTACTITKTWTGSTTTHSYTVGDSALSIDYSSTLSYATSCSGKTITLTATLSDGSALPSWITFNSAGPSFSVSTSDPDDADSYNIKIIATLNDGVGTKDETATLTLSSSVSGVPVVCEITNTITSISKEHVYQVGTV